MGCHQSPPSDSTVANPPESVRLRAGKRLRRELRYGEETERGRTASLPCLLDAPAGGAIRRHERQVRGPRGEGRQRRRADDRRVMRDGADRTRMRDPTDVRVAAQNDRNEQQCREENDSRSTVEAGRRCGHDLAAYSRLTELSRRVQTR